MKLVVISVSLKIPNIVFLKTRQAMIFINIMLGTQESIRKVGGRELMNNRITAKRFMVMVVLWKERPVSWLSTRHRLLVEKY